MRKYFLILAVFMLLFLSCQTTKNGHSAGNQEQDLVYIEAKNNNGEILYLVFNNADGNVKISFNNFERIILIEQKSASGIWYKNNEYELLGKGEHYSLSKAGKIIFEN